MRKCNWVNQTTMTQIQPDNLSEKMSVAMGMVHGRGEARMEDLRQVIPSQSVSGQSSRTVDAAGVETSDLSPNNNDHHECPAPDRQYQLVAGEEIVRTSDESRSAAQTAANPSARPREHKRKPGVDQSSGRGTTRVRSDVNQDLRLLSEMTVKNWVNQTISMFSELDIAWLAGIVDGEGSVVLFKDKRATHGLNTHVTINMVDRETIERVGAMFRYLSGNRVPVREKRPLSGFSRRLQYVVDVCSKAGCLKTLRALRPHMVTKRLQAELAISILERAVQEKNYSIVSLDETMFQLIKRLKHEDGGEARAEAIKLLSQVTPNQAILRLAFASDRMEGVETRQVSRNNNPVHERPALTTDVEDEDIVQLCDENPGSGLNGPTGVH